MEKLESLKRQQAVNRELFETEEACQKFKDEKVRQTLKQQREGARLKLWAYENKSQTRAISLDEKQIRKDPLDTGISRKKNLQKEEQTEDLLAEKLPKGYSYDVHKHFDGAPKLCHALLEDLIKEEEKKRKRRLLAEDPEGKEKAQAAPANPLLTMKLSKRPKKTSNNIKLADLGESQKKYIVPTKEDLVKVVQVSRK